VLDELLVSELPHLIATNKISVPSGYMKFGQIARSLSPA
jgi:hypothetical protein